MTTEIAIMNKSAIALAADSAVTIGNGNKFYNTANKLFTLSKYNPVGVMIYSNAEFMGYPIETIIKEYRKILNDKSFDTLEEYWNDFVKYLEKNFSDNDTLDDFYGEIISFIRSVDNDISILTDNEIEKYQDTIGSTGETINRDKILEIAENAIKDVIDDTYNWYSNLEDEDGFSEKFEIIKSSIKDKVYEIVEGIIGVINNEYLEKILDLCTMILTKKHNNGSRTGIVIAGFGNKDMLPKLVSARFMGVYFNVLKCNGKFIKEINDEYAATILPFAQDDVISTFMTGIDEGLKEDILDTIEAYNLHDCSNEECIEKLKQDIDERIKRWSLERHIYPIMDTVEVAPKEELAQMAETLVNLTSFRRKLSMDVLSQSVGGPIDVALITKGDGFIWVKRKHYFDMNKNQHFFKNYFNNYKED
ncbi:hypothetical protein [Tissierella praeacuta]|uniref:hypothetical protein n=1 Tax=Tissierella praeacuta TaxID=43131 RepID=UPI002FD8D13E